jgi:hypothetical protein
LGKDRQFPANRQEKLGKSDFSLENVAQTREFVYFCKQILDKIIKLFLDERFGLG